MAQMQRAAESCIECQEVITNPICPDCLASRMREWITEVDPELAKDIAGFDLPGPTKCLFCSKGMSICAHCYCRDIYEQLQQRNPVTAQEFLARFDFDLRREMLA